MASILDLAEKLKKLFGDNSGWFRQNKFTPVKQVKQYFNPESNRGQNFWSSKAAQGLGRVQQRGLESISPRLFGQTLRSGSQMIENVLPQKVRPYFHTPANMAINTAQTVGSGAYNIFRGAGQTARGVYNRNLLQTGAGLARTAKGTGQIVAPAYTKGGFTLFQGANLLSSLPQREKPKAYSRVAQGVLSGMSQANLPETVPSVDTKIKIPLIGDVSFDPAKKVGEMIGFTQNPTNKKLYEITSNVFNDRAVSGLFKRAGIILSKGGIEGMIQGLADLPDNSTEEDIKKYLASQIAFGAASELGFRTAGSVANKLWREFKPYLGDVGKHWTTPVKTMQYDPETGERIVMPLWKYKLKNKIGLTTQDITELSPEDYAKMKGITVKEAEEILKETPKIKIKSPEETIKLGREDIGSIGDEPKKSLRQYANEFYTNWVDRYNPISRKVKIVEKKLGKSAELRPEYNPDYLVRRLTGAGGIANNRFKTELEPIIKQADELGIPKVDLDTYLAHKRMVGFDKAGREIYGVNPEKSKAVVNALEQKYGDSIKQVADQLYKYEDKMLNELIDSGFISKNTANVMRKQNPNYAPLYRVMDEIDNYLGIPTNKTMQGTQPIKKIKGSKRKIISPVESIIANTYTNRAAIEKNNVAKAIVNLQNIVDLGFEKVSKSGNDTITTWNNGKKEYWKVGKDIADVAKGANEETMGLIFKLLRGPASILRQGATGRNPAFMIPNIVRDQLDAGITSKYGYIPFVDYVSGLKSMLTKDDAYQSWLKSGAKIDLGEMSGRKSISKYFDESTNKKNLFKWISKGLDIAGKYSEVPTRVGLYKKALKKTGNPLLSMMESREATLDFARMGAKMKVANAIIPFLNVGVQGFDKLIRSVKNQPGKVAFAMTTYAVLPQVFATIHNLTSYPEEYKQIPQYVKDSNFVIITGRNPDGTVKYSKFPKGNIVPVASNPVQNFIEHLYGQDQQSFKQLALQTIGDVLPVIQGGGSIKEMAIKTIGSNLPQAIKPSMEGLTNKSFYKYDTRKQEAKEIVPYYLKSKPKYLQAYEWTPTAYKKIGAALNISPLLVQNFLEGHFAGYVKTPSKILDVFKNLAEGKRVSPNDIPLVRRFVGETYANYKIKPKTETKVPPMGERLGIVKSVGATPKASLPSNTEDIGIIYKDTLSTINSYNKKKVLARSRGEDISLLQADVDEAIKLKKQIEKERPEQVFEIQLDTYGKNHPSSIKVPDRAKWAVSQLKDKKGKERQELINKLWEFGVLTSKKTGVAQYIKDHYGIDVWSYTGSGNYGSKGKSKKGVKITIKKTKVPTIKFTKSTAKIPTLTIPKAPTLKPSTIVRAKQPKINLDWGALPTIKAKALPKVTIRKY